MEDEGGYSDDAVMEDDVNNNQDGERSQPRSEVAALSRDGDKATEYEVESDNNKLSCIMFKYINHFYKIWLVS